MIGSNKKANKAPEPTPGLAGFPQVSVISNLVAGVAHL